VAGKIGNNKIGEEVVNEEIINEEESEGIKRKVNEGHSKVLLEKGLRLLGGYQF